VKICSKAESVRLYESGFFGNKGLTWQTLADYYCSGYAGAVVLRYRDPVGGGGPCFYDLHGPEMVRKAVKVAKRRGYDEKHIWINAQMPDHAIVAQGEYWVAETYSLAPDLFYCSDEKHQMRVALQTCSKHVSQVVADDVFRRHMTPAGWANFKWLREAFPGHVLEISLYNEPVGLLRWNSVVWEVRSY